MPELPEVETVVRALRTFLVGRIVREAVFIGKMRLPFDADATTAALSGKTVTGVRRRAKYILVDFDGGRGLLAHLGMTGYFHIDAADAPRHAHDRVVFVLDGGEELRYADARRFGFVTPVDIRPERGEPVELAGLGMEPLERPFSQRAMLERARGRRTPVKVFLMDQTVVVGVGNIYASEALFAAGIDPRRAAGELDAGEWRRLVAAVKAILRKAMRRGGSTIRNYRTVDGTEGGFQRALKVYGKKGDVCPVCGTDIETIRQCGRSTFYCPVCQT